MCTFHYSHHFCLEPSVLIQIHQKYFSLLCLSHKALFKNSSEALFYTPTAKLPKYFSEWAVSLCDSTSNIRGFHLFYILCSTSSPTLGLISFLILERHVVVFLWDFNLHFNMLSIFSRAHLPSTYSLVWSVVLYMFYWIVLLFVVLRIYYLF